ncbi:MAG: hypothetical protein HGA96_10950 [Desulfobulbaceae bacterium]|nr:hypothetical protein [Desulfobulbaceae bacterium]
MPYLIILLIAASYLNTLNSPAVLDDEHSFIFTSRIQLRELSFSSLNSLTDSTFGITRLIPILTLAANNYFSHGQAPAYHITNILIHIVTLLALAIFLKQLLLLPKLTESLKTISPTYFVWAVCGLWALSPIQTNAVTYIVQRMAALCALFYILSLALYLKARRQNSRQKSAIFFTGAALAAICSILSKENSATLPIAILLLEDFFISPGTAEKFVSNLFRRHWLIFIITAIMLIPLFISVWSNYANGYGGRVFTLTERLLTESRIVVWYISLLFLPLPSRMNLDHDFAISHSLFSPFSTILSIFLLITLLVFAYRIRRSQPLLSFGLLFFFLNLVIESSVIPLELVFEHRLYLPSVGFFISILAIFDLSLTWIIKKKRPVNLQEILCFLLIITLVACSLLTTARNNDWRDDLSIYKDMAEKSPNKSRPLTNYGMALARAKQPEKAIEFLKKAFAVGKPHDEEYYATTTNLFIAYKNLEGSEKALRILNELLPQIPPNADLNYSDRLTHNLAYTYYENKQLDIALEYATKAIFLFSTEQNQISIALCIQILGEAYDDPALREKFSLQGASKAEAVGEKLVKILIDSRDYYKASKFINELATLNPEKSAALNASLQAKLETNKRAAMISDINNDSNLANDLEARWSLKIAEFIFDHYRILSPIGQLLLENSAKRLPHDPFIKLLQLRQLLTTDAVTAKQILNEKLLQEFPDFPPLLMLAISINKTDRSDIFYRTASHLLEIYPAAPGWKPLLFSLSASKHKQMEIIPFPG